jgi:acyl-[acyl carrier protein]--UDP-N-acetylglucosamine O-acyltransferase
LFFRSDLNLSQAMQRAETDLEMFPEVQELIRFVESSQRGVVI